MFKGLRTVLVNAGIASATAALNEFAHVDWVEMVGPVWAVVIITAVNVGLRVITTTPIGRAA